MKRGIEVFKKRMDKIKEQVDKESNGNHKDPSLQNMMFVSN